MYRVFIKEASHLAKNRSVQLFTGLILLYHVKVIKTRHFFHKHGRNDTKNICQKVYNKDIKCLRDVDICVRENMEAQGHCDRKER